MNFCLVIYAFVAYLLIKGHAKWHSQEQTDVMYLCFYMCYNYVIDVWQMWMICVDCYVTEMCFIDNQL